jgi:hypothetical protein
LASILSWSWHEARKLWHLDTGDIFANIEQPGLEGDIPALRIWLARLEVIEVAGSRLSVGVAARRKPRLSEIRLVHIIGRAWTAHLGRYPAGLKRIRQDIGPQAGDGESQHGIMQFALGIGCRSVPAPLLPVDIVQMGVRMVVHARAQIHQSLGPFDQRSENIGRERVDRENVRQTVGRDVMAFPIADRGIVNDRVEATERVDLCCDVYGAGDRLQVTCYDRLGGR